MGTLLQVRESGISEYTVSMLCKILAFISFIKPDTCNNDSKKPCLTGGPAVLEGIGQIQKIMEAEINVAKMEKVVKHQLNRSFVLASYPGSLQIYIL